MTTATIQLKRPHTAQRQILAHPARFKVTVCGRRFGKSEVARQAQIRVALNGGITWWLSPTYKMATAAWKDFKRTLRPVTRGKNEVERTLELVTGGIIQVWSAHDPDTLRGSGLDLAVLDEAAYMHPDVWQGAIRPALADRRGEAMFTSTPNGRNWFWELYMLGQDPLRADWQSWSFPTSANPLIAPAEIEAARGLLPERMFKQEYLAEFLDDGGLVFRNVRACATLELGQPHPDGEYTFGVDWGKDNDYTVIAVIDNATKQIVHIDRFNEIGWRVQRSRLSALAARWKPGAIWAEANSIGGPNIEALQAEGLPVVAFITTAQSKGPLIESLALAFEQQAIAVVNDPVLVGELIAYTMERLPSGRYRYSAPVGGHDDTVIATALAWHGASRGGSLISFV